MSLRNVVLVDGARSAFGRGGRGKLVATRLDEAGATVLRALLDKHPKVTPNMIEDVGLGNVSGRGEFVGLGTVARLAGLPMEVCTFNSNRQCGSSMETLHRVAMSVMVGATDVGIALGIERMGRALGMGGGGTPTRITKLNERLFQPNDVQATMAEAFIQRAKTCGYTLKNFRYTACRPRQGQTCDWKFSWPALRVQRPSRRRWAKNWS